MNKLLSIGILREGKIPPDNRTPLSPRQCENLMKKYPGLEIKVEWSAFRCYSDEDFKASGVETIEKIDDCEVLMGIKEVPVDRLMEGKTYLFFSHTLKQQPHNQKLFQEIIRKKITLIDYEAMTDDNGTRLIGFGRWAGIVGAHHALRMWGKKYKLYELTTAKESVNLQHVVDQYDDVHFPPFRIVITGGGRVSHGAVEIMEEAGITEVTPMEYLTQKYDFPIYTVLHSEHLYTPKDTDLEFDKKHFYNHPDEFDSAFHNFIPETDILINCMFWHPAAPRLFEVKDTARANFKIRVIADVSCDVNGSCPLTTHETLIEDPVFGYNFLTGVEGKPYQENTIDVMSVANLPNELPRDASKSFGKILSEVVIPKLITNPNDSFLERATMVKNGVLTERFGYLKNYSEGI